MARYSRVVRAGLVVVVGAFLPAVGVLPANLDSPAAAVRAVRMPPTFVGPGLLLYGSGMYRHPMHLNLVRRLQPDRGGDAGSSSEDGAA